MIKRTPKYNIWMPLYIGDYLGDTSHLTTSQHGAYILLLIRAWQSGGRLSNNDESFQAITKMSKQEWSKNKVVLSDFFVIGKEYWQHDRVIRELQISKNLTDKRSESGKKGAESRWAINRIIEESRL